MKFLIQAVLAMVVIVGLVQGAPSAYSTLVPFDSEIGAYAAPKMNEIYLMQDCEGLSAWCDQHPIPLNSIDVANGREIIGWQVICDDEVVASGGVGTGLPIDTREVGRSCGRIVLHYKHQA